MFYFIGSGKKSIDDLNLILLAPLLSFFRKIKFTENILGAIDLIEFISRRLEHSLVLDRIVPYYLHLLVVDSNTNNTNNHTAAVVKSRALVVLNDSLRRTKRINVDNMDIFGEIVFDVLARASKHESDLVRAAVARTILSFSALALRYLRAKHKYLKRKFKKAWKESFAKTELAQYKLRIREIILELINKPNDSAGASGPSAALKRETLFPSDFANVCTYFRYKLYL